MSLFELKSNIKKRRKTVGRGNGFGRGTFSTRGGKSQSARSGGKIRPGFEGGQTPFLRKMPKLKGFKNPNHFEYQAVNISSLNIFDNNSEVTIDMLFEKNIIPKKNKPVKLLAGGKLEKTLTVSIHKASAEAAKAIEANKGKLNILTKNV